MIFQVLDKNEKCVGVYYDNKIDISGEIPSSLSHTWDFASYLEDKEINYAKFYCHGDTLNNVCPSLLKSDWDKVSKKIKAHLSSILNAKIDLSQNCLFDYIPDKDLIEFCSIKNLICASVFENYEKPERHAFYVKTAALIGDISSREINLDYSSLLDIGYKKDVALFLKSRPKTNKVYYDGFATKTGRLGCRGFPILNLAKKYRSIIKPTNDFLIEFDYNSAEVRVFRALAGLNFIGEDIHEFNRKKLFKGKVDREASKNRFLSWLYNPSEDNKFFEKIYPREQIVSKYWDGKAIKTPFGKIIETEHWTALNYLLQSTLAELLIKQTIKIREHLKPFKTFVKFMIHDSIVLDACEDEMDAVDEVAEIFSNTDLGKFLTNIKVGFNFGDMK